MDSAAAEEVVTCPLCAKYFSVSFINAHVNECLNNTELEDEEDFEEPIITVDQSTVEHPTCDVATQEPFLSTSDGSEPSVSKQKPIESSPLLATKSPKDKWSFLKFPKAATGQMGLGQTIKTSTSRNPNQTSQSTNCTNSRKHSFDLGSEQNDGRPTTTNAKRIKLHSSETLLSTKVLPNNESSADIRTLPSISDKSVKTVPSENHYRNTVIPLAERMRPGSLDDFVGQKEVVGSSTLLRRLLESDNFPSMILWGPPGCGKTTLARIVASRCRHLSSWRFAQLSATMSGISDIKEAIQVAKNEKSSFKRKTVLFIDEIHRFNKLQQDTFLPHVEDGTIILIGATTENPSFNINSALLSRCKVIVLEKLSSENIETILKRGLREINVGLLSPGNKDSTSRACNGESVKMLVESGVVDMISQMCDGDARCALNSLQNLVDSKSSVDTDDVTVVTVDDAREALQRSHVQYDRMGEEHYNCASALQKSIRGSSDDGAIYWLARMLEGGEDPLFIARRLVSCASEDIGMADAHALPLAVSTFQACHFLGMPECALNLAHCTTYLARAPKSNETYAALNRARESIRKHVGPLPGVPLHLRNAPTKLMKDLGYHKGYQYNHNIQGPVDQEYLPKQLVGTSFFGAPF